ncbi:glycosyltransferase family 4 protein [Neolewinella persica]|uniref:glycosyltransferase family 4 protein n=1 Tax=Neolewinella persica TaxID=70998 RepID=UPI00036DB8EB|nr:glycosyltransferase family 4 protein [Neolewinella persica]
MRIGMILDEKFPPDPRVENEAMSLIAAGHEVHLYCLKFGSDSREKVIHNGIHLHRYGVPKWLRSISALAYTIPLYHLMLKPSVKDFIETSGVEVLHIQDMRSARTVFWCNASAKLPVVLDLHENRPEIMKFYAHVKSFLGRLLIYPSWWKKREYEYIRKADRVIVITDAAKDYYVEEVGKPANEIVVVPNSVRRNFYEKYQLDQEIIERYKDYFTILYLGDTGLRRGLKTAIAGMPDILEKIPSAKLVIVGSSKDDDTLKAYSKEMGVEKNVDHLGWQKFPLFPSFILASDIGICPLHRNLHHDTTFANKIFQSMAFGKPIVVSDATAQARLVKKYDSGEVFTERQVDQYVAAVVKLYQNKEHYHRLSGNAKRAIEEELHWEVYSREILKMYAGPLTNH